MATCPRLCHQNITEHAKGKLSVICHLGGFITVAITRHKPEVERVFLQDKTSLKPLTEVRFRSNEETSK